MRFGPRSLQSRLVGSLLALLSLGMLVAGTLTHSLLAASLLDRLDRDLSAAIPAAIRTLEAAEADVPNRFDRPTPGGPRSRPDRALPPGSYVRAEVADQLSVEVLTPGGASVPPALPALLPLDEPFTLEGPVRYRALVLSEGAATLVVAFPLAEVDQTLARLLYVELLVALLVLLALAGLALLVVRSGLRPLREMEVTASRIAEGALDLRVDGEDPRTETGRLALALNVMLARLQGALADRTASESRLRRFLADASHELRTPLTSIRGYAELFRMGAASSPADLARTMDRIESEARRMGVLVDDLLLLARLDREGERPRSPVDLSALVEEVALDARAGGPDHPLHLDVAPGVVVVGAADQLRQVVLNLLANARTHTPPGTPVTLRLTSDRSGVQLVVEDAGPGLPPGEEARVFERFYRPDSSRRRTTGGAGLGLAIVASIVDAHDGSVEASSPEGGGARFVVRLPVPE